MTSDPRPFPLQELVPAELREVLCDFVWDAGKLRRLPLPVGTATVDSLRWQLDLPWWRLDDRPFRSRRPRFGRTPPATRSSTGGPWRPTSAVPSTCSTGTAAG
jgi:hypothetical protein